ncbi:LLM class flavin-dependent oxidoreductase [Planobispora takensis]|uniref:Alkanesulfonate monooxygenase n=1 Tax=Planobispora takensis TaxID=1367882 RepID=A0A8J3SZY6_9ACTN|nr:LLM class flavin-dependent oxidoreductase [Planobispora takensis]GII01455.1 alkanesulfonate monooxygenase [Planobispora takensis]
MPIEILGMVGTKDFSETHGSFVDGPPIDPPYLTRFARAHEEAGFDRVLIGYGSSSPDGFAVAASVLHATERLRVLIAHRPGFVAPTVVARKLATLDQLTGGGRVAIHHITGGDEADQRRDGDFLGHDARYRRTGEFMQVLRRTLTSPEPFDHAGEFYRFEGAYSSVRADVPLYFGGASPAAVETGARHADVYMLWGEPLAQTAERIARVRKEAARHGREITFSLSTRPIVAATEAGAWERAERIKAATAERVGGGALRWSRGARESSAVGSARLQEQGAEKEVHDERLWYGVTNLTGPGGNSTALVGTDEQVAEALLKYHDLGVTTFLIRGFDPVDDVVQWGGGLVPLLREGAARREPAAVGA